MLDLRLPPQQHVFTYPEGWTAQFEWIRSGLIWMRRPAATSPVPRSWISGADGPPEPEEFARGNGYRFGRFGPAEPITFVSMSLPLIVLLGAGLAWAAGLVLLKLPVTRNVMTFLTIALLVAVAGIWYPGPVQVLLQAAILGLLLATAMAFIQGLFRREKPAPILTLSSPSDLFGGSATGSSLRREAAPIGVGSEDLTALRPAAPPEPVSSSHSSSEI
jgi:hypothetical protein